MRRGRRAARAPRSGRGAPRTTASARRDARGESGRSLVGWRPGLVDVARHAADDEERHTLRPRRGPPLRVRRYEEIAAGLHLDRLAVDLERPAAREREVDLFLPRLPLVVLRSDLVRREVDLREAECARPQVVPDELEGSPNRREVGHVHDRVAHPRSFPARTPTGGAYERAHRLDAWTCIAGRTSPSSR